MNDQNRSDYRALIFSIVVLTGFAGILLYPESREVFRQLSGHHPYVMGFVKFFFLATTGELIAARRNAKRWVVPHSIMSKALIWGFLGAIIAFEFKIFGAGVAFVVGKKYMLLTAFLSSLAINTAFAPAMMGFHKVTDTWLDLRAKGAADTGIKSIARTIDWERFISFVILKTIPFFWLPAHTITFMLPPEFQTVMAAALSVALGVILSIKVSPK